MKVANWSVEESMFRCGRSGATYIKIGTTQRRLAWPLRKDDTQIREAFQISLLDGEVEDPALARDQPV